MKQSNTALANDQNIFWSQLPGDVSADNSFTCWLSLQCEMIADVSGALLLLGPPDSGPYLPVAHWPNRGESTEQLAKTATQALQERSALIVHRKGRSDPNGFSEWYEVAYPVLISGHLHGVIVLKGAARPTEELEAALQQLSWGAAWVEALLHRQRTVDGVVHNERLQMVLDVLATIIEHEQFHDAATAFVTDLSTRLACERVSLGFRDGDHIRLKTISHSARFGKRANLTRAIEAAMDETFDQEALILHPRDSKASIDQITARHQDLARQQGAGAICSVPLGRDGEMYGVLTFERLADSPFDARSVELCEAIAAMAGSVLELKLRDQRPLASRARESLRAHLTTALGSRYMAPKLACAAMAILVVFFTFATGQYRVPAKTLIEAQSQRVAVAPFNGYIATARVRAGDLVRSGEILATLDDRDLKLEQLKWHSQKEQFSKQYNLAMAQRNAAQVKITAAQVAQAEAELALVEDQLARTHVRAPVDGIVVSGDLSQSIGAPAERGQVLFEVAPLDVYRVVLQVDEREAAEIAVGQHGIIILSALPTRPLLFKVEKITPVSAAREGRNYFRVEAALDQAPAQLRPGMEGIGKIDIAQRRLIWIWTHRAVDWLRLLLWSWWP